MILFENWHGLNQTLYGFIEGKRKLTVHTEKNIIAGRM